MQVGAGLAARLFTLIPPAAVTGLRLWTAAAVMAVAGARPLRDNLAGLVRRRAWPDAAVVAGFGLTLAVMNFSIYQAFARIPLGIAVTVEFLGPLAVAVASSRRLIDLLWVGAGRRGSRAAHPGRAPAGGGHRVGLVGLAFALLAAAAWAAYIILSRATGRRFPGTSGLTIAMLVAAIVIDPGRGSRPGGTALLRPGILADRAGDRAAVVDHPLLGGTGGAAAGAGPGVRHLDEPGARPSPPWSGWSCWVRRWRSPSGPRSSA